MWFQRTVDRLPSGGVVQRIQAASRAGRPSTSFRLTAAINRFGPCATKFRVRGFGKRIEEYWPPSQESPRAQAPRRLPDTSVDHRPRRSRTRRTCIGNHWPPFGAAMPRNLRSAAMTLLDLRPASMQKRSMCGTLSLGVRGCLLSINPGLPGLPSLMPRVLAVERLACALADHLH